MNTLLLTLAAFSFFFIALTLGVLFRKNGIQTCATAKSRGDEAGLTCGACSVIDKENCNKNPLNSQPLQNSSKIIAKSV